MIIICCRGWSNRSHQQGRDGLLKRAWKTHHIKHRWSSRERLPLSATIRFNSTLQRGRCPGYLHRPVASPYSRRVLNAWRSQHPGRLSPGTRPSAVLGEGPGGGRQENCCNSNQTKWNKSTNCHCFLWTIRDSWRREWITATRFVNYWKSGGFYQNLPRTPL